MTKKKDLNRVINIFNVTVSILVFGTGLVLLFKFHMGGGAFRTEWLGLGKSFWLLVHQAPAIGFLIGFGFHLQRHWKYIKMVARRWRTSLPKKLKSTTREQILLLVIGLVVLWAGFYPWISMPGATLEVRDYHGWIDIHSRVGLFFLMGTAVHIKRRWRRIF